jgi:hypothetical protein
MKKEVRNVEKVLNEILLKLSNLEDGQKKSEAIQSEFNLEQKRLISKVDNIESDVSTLKSDVGTLKSDMSNVGNKVSNIESSVHEIRDIVTRIEVSQNEDVIALLKTFNSKIDSKTEALNKRLFRVESKLEAST